MVLTNLRVAQPSLFDALAKVNAGFNPIKQLDPKLAVPFGMGMGLTLDESALLLVDRKSVV